MTTKEFNYMINAKSKELESHALRFTKDQQDANDLLQETLLKAINNKNKFSYGTNLMAWLYTIMKNTFISEYHKKSRRKTFIDITENLHYINNAGNYTVCNLGENKFVLNDIVNAIDQLNHEFKTPFMMYFRGFKYHEIAEKLNLPIGTIKNRIHVARQKLKLKLNSY